MSMFDAYLMKVSEYKEYLLAKENKTREFQCPGTPESLADGLAVQVGAGANPGIILRDDTFIELGHPETGSCAFLLWTDNLSLVKDGKITLIGPDIQESAGRSLPLGQILLVAGEELRDADHEDLINTQYIADQIEGFMVRSSSSHIWSRVSKGAAKNGFSFETLARALMIIYKSNSPRVQAMECIFITSSKEDVELLGDISDQVRKIGREIIKETWKIRGYDIDCAFDCSSCTDKPVCDEIRAVLETMKNKGQNTVAGNL